MRNTRDLPVSFQRELLDLGIATDAVFGIPFSERDVPLLLRAVRTWMENRGLDETPPIKRVWSDVVVLKSNDRRTGIIVLDLAKHEERRTSVEFWIEEESWPALRVMYYEPSGGFAGRKFIERMGVMRGGDIDVPEIVRRAMRIRR